MKTRFDLVLMNCVISLAARPRYHLGRLWLGFIGIMSFWFALNALCEPVKMFRPVLPKANPADGKKHYAYGSQDHH